MGDAKMDDLRVGFDSRVKLKFCGSKITSNAGLLAYRELDEALGLTEMGADVLTDSRLGGNKQLDESDHHDQEIIPACIIPTRPDQNRKRCGSRIVDGRFSIWDGRPICGWGFREAGPGRQKANRGLDPIALPAG